MAPGESLAQCPDGTPPPCAGAARRAPPPTSVAVLYFDNLSRDTSDAYLAEGLTEEITSRLGGIERLQVSGRSVVRRAQQTSAGDPIALARQAYLRALDIEPARPVTLLNLAQYEYWQRQPERALRWADSVLAVDPRYTSGRAWRAALGDDERTLQFLERVRPRAGLLAGYLRDPAFDRVRAHPGFQRIVAESAPRGVRAP